MPLNTKNGEKDSSVSQKKTNHFVVYDVYSKQGNREKLRKYTMRTFVVEDLPPNKEVNEKGTEQKPIEPTPPKLEDHHEEEEEEEEEKVQKIVAPPSATSKDLFPEVEQLSEEDQKKIKDFEQKINEVSA